MFGKIVVVAFIFSMLPIWRNATSTQGFNLWQNLRIMTSEEHRARHIDVGLAVEEAREAYRYYYQP